MTRGFITEAFDKNKRFRSIATGDAKLGAGLAKTKLTGKKRADRKLMKPTHMAQQSNQVHSESWDPMEENLY